MDPIIAGIVGAAIGAVGVWLIERQRAPHGVVRYWGGGRRRPWQRPAIPPSADEIERLQLNQDPLIVTDRSPLVRVIGVGEAQSADGVTVECVSLELRESGGRGLLRTHAAGGLHGPWPEGRVPTNPTPRLEDDLGTAYEVTMPGWTGGDRDAEMVFRFAPTRHSRRVVS